MSFLLSEKNGFTLAGTSPPSREGHAVSLTTFYSEICYKLWAVS